MKHTEEELEKNRFFQLINSLTDRFYQQKDIDLAQLEELVKNGEIQVAYPIVAENNWYEVVKECKFLKQQVSVIEIKSVMKGLRLQQLLEGTFEPLTELHWRENDNLLPFIESNITNDSKIYVQHQYTPKRMQYPHVYAYGNYGNEPLFLIYRRPGYRASTIDNCWSRPDRRYPLYVREQSLIIVGKKKV